MKVFALPFYYICRLLIYLSLHFSQNPSLNFILSHFSPSSLPSFPWYNNYHLPSTFLFANHYAKYFTSTLHLQIDTIFSILHLKRLTYREVTKCAQDVIVSSEPKLTKVVMCVYAHIYTHTYTHIYI